MKLGLALAMASLFAIGQAARTAQDPTVLVRRFESRYRSARNLRANFLQEYFDNGKLVRSEAGRAYFGKPGKMRWEYLSPEPNLYLVDGKWSWFFVPADHTVTKIRARSSNDTRTPFALLAGEMKVSRICRHVGIQAEVKPTQAGAVVLRCDFRTSEDQVRSAAASSLNSRDKGTAGSGEYAQFEVDPSTGELIRVRIFDPGGTEVQFQFSGWEFDPRIDPGLFHFDPPRGVAIVDGTLPPGSNAAP